MVLSDILHTVGDASEIRVGDLKSHGRSALPETFAPTRDLRKFVAKQFAVTLC